MTSLTLKQQNFFNNLKDKFSARALPSYEAISKILGYKSKNSIRQYINVLIEKNYIEKIENSLYINSKYLGANLASSYLRAGFASIMDDKIEKRISFDNLFEINSPSTFVFKVSGDSMVDVGIFDGDYVIIKKTQFANVDDIVLAIIDNEFTLKTYKKENNKIYLQPQNKNYSKMYPKYSFSIFGVAVGITRKFY